MINAVPGFSAQQLPQGITPEMLANPQFLAMLRAQMGGGAQQPRMGGGGGGMPQGLMQQQGGGSIFGAGGMGQLAQFLRPYMQQQPGARQDTNAGNLGNGLLGALPSFNDGGAKSATSGTPGGYQEAPVQQGLLAGYGGLY